MHASQKSGTISSAVISLPLGGVALHSIGEKFSPDLLKGTAPLSVPITLPLGRNGLEPQFMYADHLPPEDVSLLQQVQVLGHARNRAEILPPLAFGYTAFAREERDFLR